MAFTDRIVQYPGRVKMTPVSGQTNVYDMTAQEGTVTTEGTLLNAANLNQQTQLDSAVLEQFQSAGMAGQYQNDMSNALSFIINGAVITEYGNVQGGTGNYTWYYRKWSSGMEEAWGMCSVSSVTGSVWTSPIYYYDWTVTWPSMFTSAPTQAYVTSRNFQWTVVGHDVPTTTGMKMRLTKPVSSAQNIYVDIYLVHR